MNSKEESNFFDRKRAASYDKRFEKLAPMKDALHLLIRLVLSELPVDGRILCVGAGTGSELIYLADAFPHWRFTVVEPAEPMLNICRQRAEERGIASRCTFHEGYIDSLPESAPFDAATCILVSQFIMQLEDRHNFFRNISARLIPGGYLVSADLAAETSESAFNSLFEIWIRSWKYTGMTDEEVENHSSSFGQNVAILSPQAIESIIESSGFDKPILFFQTLLIHAWYSRRVS